MRFLFVTWAGGGNSTPVIGLATRLIQRGHDVKVVSPDDSGPRFAEIGVPYAVMPRAPRAVVDAIKQAQPDVVVVDFMMPEWLCEAEASGRPTVALVHTLYAQISVGILTAFTTLEAINAGRQELGLDSLVTAPEVLDRMARVLVTSYESLEDDAIAVGANTKYVGAILEEIGPDAGWSPPPTHGLPLVVASLGTTPGLDDHVVLANLLDAVASLPVHIVLNCGAHLDRSTLAPPDNVTLAGYIRHAAVLPHAAAVVTHAGLGVTLAALSYGLPMVSVPLGRDQPATARRVDAVGAGVVVPVDASPADLRDAIESVLGDSRYRAAAQRFAAEYDPTASVALRELEALT